jgi:HK97 gp10 family phage protein
MVDLQMAISPDLLENLTNLEPRIRKKALNKALREAAKLVLTEVKTKAPKKTNALRRSFKIRVAWKGSRNKHVVAIALSTNATDNMFTGKTFYGAFQEFGWKPGKRIGKYGRISVRGGAVSGKHYLENSFKAKATEALNTIQSTMYSAIQNLGK